MWRRAIRCVHAQGASAPPVSMRAVQVATREDGKRPKPEDMYVSEVPLPTSEHGLVGPNDLLIKVGAAGINRPDVLQRMGAYPAPKGRETGFSTKTCAKAEATDYISRNLVQKHNL